MPGLYLLAILASAAGVAALDHRFRLAAFRSPRRTLLAVAIGTAFFLLWDAVGIAAGVFVKGDSDLLLGVDLAPHLPLEEPFFLAFLSYLAVVAWQAAQRPNQEAR
ncbi:lycopene cyclase domain-containing protein [Glycomyces sp. NPDC047010]|uniref:lycopene cyclase domain-containing protein n=1 Tax=Glycomyces sp. NPDC047010 TaxID=3155023 RepID=UPI0033FE1B29